MPVEEWLAIRKAEGLKINPTTAEVDWDWRQILPDGIYPDQPEECDCVGRVYFARRPGSEIWVEFATYQTRYALHYGSGWNLD
jgi:hypothetical protein